MISYMPNSMATTSAPSQQPSRPFDSENGEQGVMGFVMPENQTVESGLSKPHSSQPVVIQSIPEHLLVELKQHPQLLNAITENLNLVSKFDVESAVNLQNKTPLAQSQLGLASLATTEGKTLSPELTALLASLNQQSSSVYNSQNHAPIKNHAPINSSFNQQATNLPLQGAQSALPPQHSFAPLDMQPSQIQVASAATHIGQASFQPVIAEVANTELDNINQAINQLTQANTKGQTVSQWGPVSVTQSAPMLHQANEMMSPLRDQLRFQIDQQIKQAELRLDPPELGKVELSIRLDGDRLHVQMHAANPAVRDALLMGLERLRMELEMDHGGQVDVDIGQQESQQHAQHKPQNINAETTMVSQASEQHFTEKTQKDQVDLLA